MLLFWIVLAVKQVTSRVKKSNNLDSGVSKTALIHKGASYNLSNNISFLL